VVLGTVLSGAPSEKRISIYSKVANYSLAVSEVGGQDYVGLLEILEPLGAVSAKVDGSRWKLRFNDVDAEFVNGRKRAKVRKSEFDLPSNFVMENGRGLVPLSSLSQLMPRFLGGPVNFHESSRRLFIGDVAVHFTAQIGQTAPPILVMNFTSPVNPSVATEPGKLLLSFSHEALVAPGSTSLSFGNKLIPSATYQESNGAAQLTIAGTAPLFARFSNEGRTITVTGAPASPTTQALAEPAANTNSAAPSPPAAPTNPQRYFVVVDASHGGDERGAALNDQLAEKDVTLAFARRLAQELQSRGMPAMLLRNADTALTLDQRANLTNSLHPALYVCFHASSQMEGVRVYTALVPPVARSRGPFLDWMTAHSPFLPKSQIASSSVAAALQQRQIPVRRLVAPLRPLNNLIVPAIAIEVAPPGADIGDLNSASYQQQVASAVAAGIAAVHDELEAGR
jgi:N-acetylmuramoyl-L-alanine amidase